jgi:hypothetical protein
MKIRLVIGSVRNATNSYKTTHCLLDDNDSVSTLWTADHQDNALAVAMAPDHTVYTGGPLVSSAAIRKYNASGTEQTSGWPVAQSTFGIRGLAVVGNTDIITGNDSTVTSSSGNQVRKIAANGTQQWQVAHRRDVYSVAVDSSGNIGSGGSRTSLAPLVTTRYYNSSGVIQWSVNHGTNPVYGVAFDPSGNLISVGEPNSSITTRKYNSSGTQQWTANHGTSCYSVACDADGNIYTGGAQDSSLTTRKYNSAGTLQWSVGHGATVRGLAIIGGYLYTTGDRTSNITTRKYDLSGNLIWSWDAGGTSYAIAGAVVLESLPPGLALPIRLAIPFATIAASPTSLPPGLALPFSLRAPLLITDREDIAPGLAFPVALRLPTLRIEHPTAYRYPDVYALHLGGVLLPFSTITCRRDTAGLILTATIPSASAALLSAVAANEGETLRVLRGPRLPDGSVQLDHLWSATMDRWSYRQGALAGSITLQASAAASIQASRPRFLQEASYGNASAIGRRVRCRIDSYLQPGDVALWAGHESIVVNQITYSIQPGSAFMELQGL